MTAQRVPRTGMLFLRVRVSAAAVLSAGDPGGARTSFILTLGQAGRYAYKCQNHASAGMVGTFVVP